MPDIVINRVATGPLEENCYLLWDRETKDTVCIDPGNEPESILSVIKEYSLNILYILNTHGHFDHTGGNYLIMHETNCKLALHGEDLAILKDMQGQAMAFGLSVMQSPLPDIILKDNDKIKAGHITMTVLHTPGHTPGSVSLFVPKTETLFSGDTLFYGSIGRTDLRGGSYTALTSSIKNRLIPLGDNIRVLPGHGDETTIGRERLTNPFLA